MSRSAVDWSAPAAYLQACGLYYERGEWNVVRTIQYHGITKFARHSEVEGVFTAKVVSGVTMPSKHGYRVYLRGISIF